MLWLTIILVNLPVMGLNIDIKSIASWCHLRFVTLIFWYIIRHTRTFICFPGSGNRLDSIHSHCVFQSFIWPVIFISILVVRVHRYSKLIYIEEIKFIFSSLAPTFSMFTSLAYSTFRYSLKKYSQDRSEWFHLHFSIRNKKHFNFPNEIFFSWQLKNLFKDTTSIILDKNKIVLRSTWKETWIFSLS